MKIFCNLILLICLISFTAFHSADGCNLMHKGKFKYTSGKEEVIVTISDSNFTETYQDGKYFVKAQLDWLNDCEYNLVITKVNAPGMMYMPGDEINVKINRVEGIDIFYTATVKRVSWEGKFTKLQE